MDLFVVQRVSQDGEKVKLLGLWGWKGSGRSGLELPEDGILQQVQEDKMVQPLQREAGPGGGGLQLNS